MPKKVLATSIAAFIALLVALPAGAATTPPSGSGNAVNTILSVSVTNVASAKLGVDHADSLLSSAPYAAAGLDVLQSDTQKVSGATRDTRKGAGNGSTAIGAGTKTISGVATANVTSGAVSTFINSKSVSSSISFDVASADLLSGLATAGTVKTTTATTVGQTSASVSRQIDIGTASLGSLRALLDALGVDPFALGCAGLEGAGVELGVDTSQGCETLQGIQGDIADAEAALAAAKTDLETDLATATATVADTTIITPALVALAAEHGVDLSGSLGLPISAAQRQALIDAIQARLDSVNAGLVAAADETCDAVLGSLDEVSTEVPDLASTLDPIETALSEGCDTLAGLLDDLLDVSLLSVDGIDVSLTAVAKPNTPAASALGSLGEIKVGNVVTISAPISLGADAVTSAAQTLKNSLGTALTALGLGTFPTPSIEILKSTASKGKKTDGTWFAKAEVTTLHVGLPSTTLTTPETDTLGVLGSSAAAAGPGAAATITTPVVNADLAAFNGSSTFKPGVTTDGGVEGGLAETGLPSAVWMIGGVFVLGAAYGLRRFLTAV